MNINKYLLISILILYVSCGTKDHQTNPYGLDVISTMKDYHKTVKAEPSKELVRIVDTDPSILVDIKYATDDNFVGQAVYDMPEAFARKPVVDALVDIQNELSDQNLGLKVFDAYRPYAVTVKFYEIIKDTMWVAAPWHGSRHNRGCAVDLTLVDLNTGEELAMPTGFDDTDEKAHVDFMELPEEIIKNRELLITTMKKHGFTVYPYEWWHYDFEGWENYELLDISFDKPLED